VSTAIVVLSKHPEIFEQCQRSVKQHGTTAAKILVRDGNDISSDWIIVQGVDPFVYARNANLGITKALKNPSVDSVLLMNDDVSFIHEETVEKLRIALFTNPEVGLISPRVMGWACNPAQRDVNTLVHIVDDAFITFVCIMIKREVIEKIGTLDERFIGYGSDDVDYCRRARIAGYKLAVTSSVIVKHFFEGKESSASYLRIKNQDELSDINREAYADKWRGKPEGRFKDEGRVLIGIRSCVRDALRGDNQASRDTWIKDVRNYSGFDYKFFIGDGTPTGDLEEPKYKSSWGEVYVGRKQEAISEITPNRDEEILHCPDDYFHMPYKLREICRYAVKYNYEYLFTPCDDVYVDVYRLWASRFEKHDYIGNFWNNNTYAHGGPGFWLSKKAFTAIANSPVTSTHDDEWAGLVLAQHGIKGHHDTRYAYDSDVLQDDTVTLHLSFEPGTYKPEWMLETAKRWPVNMSTLRKRSSIVPSTILPELTAEEVPAPKIPTVVEERMVGSRARPLVMHPDGRLRSKRT
jgi:hypothetical protein